jgi:Protein of unknown function (DUF3551)
MRMIFVAATLASLAFSPQPAAADYHEAPWCAVIGMGRGVYWDCQYWSLQQCVPIVLAGNRGFCNPNPSFVPRNRRPYRRL